MKKFLAMMMALSMAMTMAACGSSGNSGTSTSGNEGGNSGAEKVTIKFGNTAGEEDIQTKSLREVAQRLSDATNGNFEAQVYPSSSLGDTDDLMEQGMQGAAILTVSDPSRLASFVPDFGILLMPYIFEDYTGLNKVMETELYAGWEKELSDKGIWLVTNNWFSGTRNFTLNKEVKVPADLNGQRIRTIGNDICTKSVNAMGAVATPMSWSEVYTSIQQKALDGAEVQTPSFYATRLWEVTKYINKTEHFQLIGSCITGTKFRDSLSDDYRELFEKTFYDVGTEYQTKCVEESEAEEKEMVEKYGLIINEDVDVQAFKDASAPVYDELGYAELREELMKQMGE